MSWTIIHLGPASPQASSDLPESRTGRAFLSCDKMDSYLVLLRVGFSLPRLLPAARCALTAPFHPYLFPGGIFSVALSVGSRLPGVTWHSALWSPDFPPFTKVKSDCLTNFKAEYSKTSVIRIGLEYKFEVTPQVRHPCE